MSVDRRWFACFGEEQEARISPIDFSATFSRVNYLAIFFNLCSVGVRGLVMSTVTQFLSNRSQYVVVDVVNVN